MSFQQKTSKNTKTSEYSKKKKLLVILLVYAAKKLRFHLIIMKETFSHKS